MPRNGGCDDDEDMQPTLHLYTVYEYGSASRRRVRLAPFRHALQVVRFERAIGIYRKRYVLTSQNDRA